MPWTHKQYPLSMRNLPRRDRIKAIGIANAFVDKGYSDEQAIVFATAEVRRMPVPRERSASSRPIRKRPARRAAIRTSSVRPSRTKTRHGSVIKRSVESHLRRRLT